MRRETRQSSITFLGPITVSDSGCHFNVLQPKSGLIKLEYPDKPTAKAARDQLLQSSHTHKVASNKLLQAICDALGEASGENP